VKGCPVFDNLFAYDLWVLHKLNVDWASPETDQFWLAITHLHKLPWVIYGVLPALLLWLIYIYKWQAIKPLIAVAVVVGLTDVLCYRVIKSQIQRPRPFQNEEISSWLRPVGEAHGPSFPSNHAANCFAGAAILAWYFRRSRYIFYTLAMFVALSRPALGVHYPSDALAGALIGYSVAILLRGCVLNQSQRFGLPLLVSNKDDKKVESRSRIGRST
jgi:undecaprenyl-diphosphatase